MLNRRRGWHRLLTGVGVAAAVIVALGIAPASPASAQDDCEFRFGTAPNGDEVLIWTCSGGYQGGGNGTWTCHINFQGQPMQVPCVDPVLGWFTNTHGGCYIKPASPQPPASDPAWDGHDPGEAVVYVASCFAVDGVDGLPYVHLPIMRVLSATEGVIADLIEQAIALLPLRGADIHIAPDPSGVGLVGLPVWMWTPTTGETWGPLTDSLTALGVTVGVEANADQIRWDMGDGTERVCRDPGTPYHPDHGADSSPTCGHAYERPSRTQPDGRYTVTAVTEWHIDWWIEGTAISGMEIRTREAATTVRINELQVVTS